MAPIPRGFLRTGHSTSFKCKYASDWDLKVVARLAKSTDAPHHVITKPQVTAKQTQIQSRSTSTATRETKNGPPRPAFSPARLPPASLSKAGL